MDFLAKTFNNREIALFIYFCLFIGILSLKKVNILSSFIGIVKAFFKTKLLSVFIIMTCYVATVVYGLYKLGFWDQHLLFCYPVFLFRWLSNRCLSHFPTWDSCWAG